MTIKRIRTFAFALLFCALLLLPAPEARADMGTENKGGQGNVSSYYTDRSQMKYAEFLLMGGDYLAAVSEFGRVIELFPGSRLLEEVQFKIAVSYLRGFYFNEAEREFAQFIRNFPESELLMQAELLRQGASRGEVVIIESFFAGETAPVVETVTVSIEEQEVVEAKAAKVEAKAAKAEAKARARADKREAKAKAKADKVEAKAKAKAAKIEAARSAAEEVERAKAEVVRIEAEKVEAARIEAEMALALEVQAELETIAREEQETAKKEATRIEAEIAEAARIEAELAEADRIEAERIEAARIEAELAEDARLEADIAADAVSLEAEAEEELRLARIKDGTPEVELEEFRPIEEAKKIIELPEPTGPLKAMQVMLFNGTTTQEIAAELDQFKSAGVDTVIIRAFHNDGDRLYPHLDPELLARMDSGFYFNTSEAPVVVDMLGELIDLAHERGIRVFAWMTTRYANYGVEDRDDLSCLAYDIKTKRTIKCKGLNVFNEKVIARLEKIYSDLAEYQIDGVLFQDDLILRHNEGVGEDAAAEYLFDTGKELAPANFYLPRPNSTSVEYTDDFWQWAKWKNRKLLELTEKLKVVVRAKRPNTKFAINLMYEAVTNPGAGLAWLSQDLTEARNIGFDYYSIMAYHRQMGKELNKDPQAIKEMITTLVADAVEIVGDPESVLIKFQSIDWNTREQLPISELVKLARAVKDIDDVSLALVPYLHDFSFNEIEGGTVAH